MADIEINGLVTWLKNWFYDKTELASLLNSKVNLNQSQANKNVVTDASGNISVEDKPTIDSALSSTSENAVQNKTVNTALGNKVDKVSGKGLSTNDYTTTEKNKLAGIETGANKTIVDSAMSSTSTNPVQNRIVYEAIRDAITNLDIIETVTSLPSNPSQGKIYLLGTETSSDNDFDIYVYNGADWEHIDSFTINLTDYSTTAEMNAAISTAIASALASYSTTSQMNSAINTAVSNRLQRSSVFKTATSSDIDNITTEGIYLITDTYDILIVRGVA